MTNLYDTDFVEWSDRTAQLLREHRFEELELDPLIDEVESLGRSERNQLWNRYSIVLEHCLCRDYWIPVDEREQNRRGWELTVAEQTRRIKRLLKVSPSLKPYFLEIADECYADARESFLLKSGREYDLADVVPMENPYPVVS